MLVATVGIMVVEKQQEQLVLIHFKIDCFRKND